jgi:hypothetical protein
MSESDDYCPKCGVSEPPYFFWSLSVAGDVPDHELIDQTIGRARLCAYCASEPAEAARWLLSVLGGSTPPITPPAAPVTAQDVPAWEAQAARRAARRAASL